MGENHVVRAEPGTDALAVFVASTSRWAAVPVPLTVRLSTTVWAVALVNLAVAGWAVTVLAAGWSCSWFLCRLSTLGGRPSLQLALAGGCVLAIVVLAVATGGLTRAGGGQLAALTSTALVGVAAAAGAVLAFLLVAIAVAAVIAFLLNLIERL